MRKFYRILILIIALVFLSTFNPNRFKENLEDLKQFGKIDRNWIHGITVRELNDRYKKYLKLDVNSGVIVSDVEKKSAAAVAGILIRDIIYKVNGKSVNSSEEIEEILD